MTWILLALIAPFFWALSNIFDKYALSKLSRNTPDFIFFGTIGSIIVALILYFTIGVEPIAPHLIIIAMLGGALLNYSYIFYAKALDKADATRVVPLFQTIPIFTLILGYLFFDEFVSNFQLFGFIVVFIGGVILTTEKSLIRKFRIDLGFWLMLISSLLISISMLFSDHVLESVSFLTLFTYDLIGFSLAGFSLMLYPPWRKAIVRGIKEARPSKYALYFLNDGADMAGHVFYKFALISAPSAALVSVMLGVQPFYLLVIGIILTLFLPKIIKEDISGKVLITKFSGIAIIFAGIAIIMLL